LSFKKNAVFADIIIMDCFSRVKGVFVSFLFIASAAGLFADVTHTVKAGDTLYSLSREYGVPRDVILSVNGINNPSLIKVGQKLRIPDSASTPKTQVPTEYIVKKGDTLYSLATKHGMKPAELLAFNKLPANYMLKVGDKLKIPGSAPPSSGAKPTGNAGAESNSTQKPPAATVAATTPETAAKKTPAPNQAAPKKPSAASTLLTSNLKWPVKPVDAERMTGKLPGVVLTGTRGEPVKSISSGRVISAGPYRGFGRVVIVESAGGYLYVYGGCETLSVRQGDIIYGSSEIGTLGIDAASNKPQLFLSIYKNSKAVDPAKAPRT
jgi:LysM repeat protein